MKPSLYDLVRRDLIELEQQDIQALGTPREPYRSENGSEALLDAYQASIELCLALRSLLDHVSVGQPTRNVKDWPQR